MAIFISIGKRESLTCSSRSPSVGQSKIFSLLAVVPRTIAFRVERWMKDNIVNLSASNLPNASAIVIPTCALSLNLINTSDRSSSLEMFCKKDVRKNFVKLNKKTWTGASSVRYIFASLFCMTKREHAKKLYKLSCLCRCSRIFLYIDILGQLSVPYSCFRSGPSIY